jgi:ribosomal protein S18 acetylase RimI-like enzyme
VTPTVPGGTAHRWPRALLRRVEDAGLNASAPSQQLWVDGWIVRLSPGKAKRARCINAVARGARPLEEKLRECEGHFRAAGLPLIVRLTPFSQPADLDARLARLGWTAFDDTRVMVFDRLDGVPVAALPEGVEEVVAGPAHLAQAVGALRGSALEQVAAHAERLARSPVPCRGLLWRRGDDLLACAQAARQGDLVGLYDVFTAPSARGQGLARALCARLLAQAAADGARIGYLQVDAGNTPARAVYRRLGFVDGYAYHYRSPDRGAV